MALFSTNKPVVSKPGIIKSGQALVGKPNVWGKADDQPKNIGLFQKYKNAYQQIPLINGGINVITDQVVQDFYFEGPSAEKLQEFSDVMNLPIFLHKVCKDLMIFGNAFVEVVVDKSGIDQLKHIDPVTMEVIRDRKGKLLGYMQVVNDKKLLWGKQNDNRVKTKQVGKKEDIVHFKYNVVGTEKLGTSLIHSVLPLVMTKLNMEANLSVIIQRYIAPIIHAKVGDKDHPPSAADIATAEAGLEDIYADTEYVTSWLVDLEVLGFKDKTLNFDQLFSHVDKQIITGIRVPPVLLGRSEGGKEASEVQLRNFGRMIKAIQRLLKADFEDKIIQRFIGTEKDKLIWGTVEERERMENVEILKGLVGAGIITPQKANQLLPPKFHEKLPDPASPLLKEDTPMKGMLTTDPTKRDGKKKSEMKNPLDDKGGQKSKQPKVIANGGKPPR